MEAEARAHTERLPRLEKYDVLEELGHGGMATVYRAADRRLGRDVAIKVIHPHLRDSPEVGLRFAVEAQAVAKLRHPNIVEVYDVSGEGEREKYLVCEYIRGTTLRKLLQKKKRMPPEVAAAFALDMLGALAHAHGAGVIHRDIKPENVMIDHRELAGSGEGAGADSSKRSQYEEPPSGERAIIKLMDFGIAKLLDAQGVTSTGQVLGSPAHMAPEQIEGGDVDARADVFGMGVLLYECMVGHLPFEGNNPAQVLRRVLDGTYPSADAEVETIGKRWSSVLDRALAHDQSLRFESANAMRDALCEELKRLGIGTPRVELEAYLDDPAGYEERHARRMIDALCERAGAARKRGDAISAASDYNRALGYTPNDPTLLRIVTSMHRAESRARLMGRAGRVVGAMVALGALAFGVARVVRSSMGPDIGTVTPVIASEELRPKPLVSSPSLPLSVSAVSAVSADPSIQAPPQVPASVVATVSAAPTLSSPTATPATSQKPPVALVVERAVTLGSLRPPILLLSLDGAGPLEVTSGTALKVDGRPHTLRFTCKEDLCTPLVRTMPEGDTELVVDVALDIKPAKLVIEGDSRATYQLVEFPTITLHAGVPASVPMRKKSETVTVMELPSNRARQVMLTAGKSAAVSFGE